MWCMWKKWWPVSPDCQIRRKECSFSGKFYAASYLLLLVFLSCRWSNIRCKEIPEATPKHSFWDPVFSKLKTFTPTNERRSGYGFTRHTNIGEDLTYLESSAILWVGCTREPVEAITINITKFKKKAFPKMV